jgi:hypothetical protein
MACLFIEGFDKYGPTNSNSASVIAMLQAGEWTAASGTLNVAAPLSATGQAMLINGTSGFNKTLAANYARLIGGVRFSSTNAAQAVVIQFRDGATAQCTLCVETTGVANLRTGGNAGTILLSGGSISANSTHYFEWDITFSATGAYQVWLDGVSLFSGTGNTHTSANNYANVVALGGLSATTSMQLDDFYLFDSTGTINNAVLLTSPRVETTFPNSDSAVQFAFGAAVLGSPAQRTAVVTNSPAANTLFLRPYIPSRAGTLNSVTIVPAATNAATNYRPVVYADSAGAAGTLMSAGSTVTGTTVNTPLTMPLTTPQSLVAGTQYWLGMMNDITTNLQQSDGGTLGYRVNTTFASGAPGSAGAMTSGQPSFLIWGNLTGLTVNNYEVNQQPPPGTPSYVFDATVGHEDLYGFNALSVPPTNVYAVAVKAYVSKSDSGTKTCSMRMKSGATDSAGSLAGQAPGTTFGWLTSMFETDPNGAIPWTGANLNAATSGIRVDS